MFFKSIADLCFTGPFVVPSTNIDHFAPVLMDTTKHIKLNSPYKKLFRQESVNTQTNKQTDRRTDATKCIISLASRSIINTMFGVSREPEMRENVGNRWTVSDQKPVSGRFRKVYIFLKEEIFIFQKIYTFPDRILVTLHWFSAFSRCQLEHNSKHYSTGRGSD